MSTMILTKRRKFLITSLLLTGGFLAIQYIPIEFRYHAIILLGLAAYPLSCWSLWEDLDGIEWAVNLILPVLFLPSLALFYFLLPAEPMVKIVIIILAAFGQYGILLSSNIFSVAVIRTIQLLRAAQAVGFLFTLLIAFFLFNTLFSFKLLPYYSAPLVVLITFPLVIQSLWTVRLDKKTIGLLTGFSFMISFLLGQASLMINLWPIDILISSLFLVSVLYIILSLLHHYLNERLFAKTTSEYVRIGVLIFMITFFLAKWGG